MQQRSTRRRKGMSLLRKNIKGRMELAVNDSICRVFRWCSIPGLLFRLINNSIQTAIMQDNQPEPQDDDLPEEIVEHLAELGFHPEDNDPEDDGLDEILKDAPSTPPNYYGGHPGCKVTVHKPKPR